MFITDNVTLDDLSIFQAGSGRDSLYNLFNETQTAGGERLLREMFLQPFDQPDEIGHRIAIIQYFAGNNKKFSFSAIPLTDVVEYISDNDERNGINAENISIGFRMGNLIAEDGRVRFVRNGVRAVLLLVQTIYNFARELDIDKSHSYYPETLAVRSLISKSDLSLLAEKDASANLSLQDLGRFDEIIRFNQKPLVLELLDRLYHIDVYESVARTANRCGFTFPHPISGEKLRLVYRGLYHPLLKNAVSNDITIDETTPVVLLTGANMAGKSTLMKSIAANLYLAHMGFPVAASRLEFSVFSGFYTTINLSDNLAAGASHFYAEVLRLKKVVMELKRSRRLFVVFDEMFRGTNVKDAHEATVAVIKGFTNHPQSVFIISTHIIEAASDLSSNPSIQFQFLPTLMTTEIPEYTFQLQHGISADRHGMLIVRKEGILDILANGLQTKVNHAI